MAHKQHRTGVADRIGAYSDAVEVAPGARWLMSAGTPGLLPSGELPPDIVGQSENAWRNVLDFLERAGMGYADLVKVTTSLTDSAHIAQYAEVRSRVLGDLRPAFMLAVVPQLVRPEFLVEIEVVAAKT